MDVGSLWLLANVCKRYWSLLPRIRLLSSCNKNSVDVWRLTWRGNSIELLLRPPDLTAVWLPFVGLFESDHWRAQGRGERSHFVVFNKTDYLANIVLKTWFEQIARAGIFFQVIHYLHTEMRDDTVPMSHKRNFKSYSLKKYLQKKIDGLKIECQPVFALSPAHFPTGFLYGFPVVFLYKCKQ